MQSTMNCILLFHGWNFYGGKAYNPCPPGWQKYFDILRDYFNIKENWARPDDPTRARLYVPEQADLNNARLIRWGKTPLKKEEREQAKETLHSYIIQQIEQGKIKNRTDITSITRYWIANKQARQRLYHSYRTKQQRKITSKRSNVCRTV